MGDGAERYVAADCRDCHAAALPLKSGAGHEDYTPRQYIDTPRSRHVTITPAAEEVFKRGHAIESLSRH